MEAWQDCARQWPENSAGRAFLCALESGLLLCCSISHEARVSKLEPPEPHALLILPYVVLHASLEAWQWGLRK